MKPGSREQIDEICRLFSGSLAAILGDKLVHLIVYGAAAFPDPLPTGDIDFHVILNNPLTAQERTELTYLHTSLAERFPPLGGELDGYYILLDDAKKPVPPKSQMWQGAVDNAWALHRAHIRAGRCIILYGPDPVDLYPGPNWTELEAALLDELAYVGYHLDQYPDYCILNLCRLLYSFETRDVVISKAAAAEWAEKTLPHWQPIIEMARRSYARQGTGRERELMLMEVGALFHFVCLHINDSRKVDWKQAARQQ